MKKLLHFSLFLFFVLSFSLSAQNEENKREKFDPTRNPAEDLKIAIKQAKKENKRILLDVGGEWCKWCHILDKFIEENPDVRKAFSEAFIVLKVNYSKENKNEKFLEAYPKIKGYPHFFILDSNGKFLASQDTGELEEEDSYSKEKLLNFANKWKK